MTTEVTASVAQLDVKLGGRPISSDLDRALSEIEVENNLYLPDAFTLKFHLSSLGDRLLDIPDTTLADYLSQGTEVVIAQNEEGNDLVIMDGEVTSVGLEFSSVLPGGQLMAVVQGFDRSHRLHRGRHTRTFLQMSYSDIVSSVVGETGLQASVDATSGVFDYVIQSNQTDWEFLWQLAHRVGYEVYVSGKEVCFKRPRQERGSAITLDWGTDLMQFRARSSTAFQTPTVTVRGWDPKSKEAILGQATSGEGSPQLQDSRSGVQQSQSAFGAASHLVVDRPVATQAEADGLAQAICDGIAGDFIEAEGVTSHGMGGILPGVNLEIRGLGQRSGAYYVTATTHRFTGYGGYTTDFTVGGRQARTVNEYLAAGPRHSGLSQVQGVVIGLVSNNNDPDGLSRVKVDLPWLGEQVESNWARLAAPGAGPGRGLHWLPEVGDEVLVAFEHGDIHRPFVLGGLWNSQDAAPVSNLAAVGDDGKVNRRTLRSREGFNLTISDESGSRYVGIANPDDDSKIVIKHDDKVVEILSNGDINITGAQGKITVEGQDLEIKSSSNMKLNATGNVDISAGGNLTLKGTGQASLEATGQTAVKGAQTSLEGSAMAEIKGALVKIN